MSAFFSHNKPRPVQPVALSEIRADESNSRFKTDLTDLVESISRVGMIQPVMLSPDLRLISGKRRFAAAKQMGLEEIPAIILTLSSALEELAAIDENLVRLPLNSLEYDEALYRRKMIYEEQFPDTRQGVAGAKQTKEIAFTEDTAQKFDISRRSVEFAIARAKNASPKVKEARIKGLAASKVNELVSLDQNLQDEVLPLVEQKAIGDVREIVRKVKEFGLEETIAQMNRVIELKASDFLMRDLQRVQKDLSTILKSETPLGIPTRAPVVKQTKGVMRMMRAFLGRVKIEAGQEPRDEHPHVPSQSAL